MEYTKKYTENLEKRVEALEEALREIADRATLPAKTLRFEDLAGVARRALDGAENAASK